MESHAWTTWTWTNSGRTSLHPFSNAFKNLPDSLAEALEAAADRIRAFHELQPLPIRGQQDSLGGRLGTTSYADPLV